MHIPADVPKSKKDLYIKNMQTLCKGTERCFLFAGDQKIEHLHADFYGPGISADAADPEHLFKIAAGGNMGAFATHLGLIARYGNTYAHIPYLAKLNGKTNIIDTTQTGVPKPDPISSLLWTVDDVIALQQQAGLIIPGIGLTVYPGSEFEHTMLQDAAQTIVHAHQEGLVAVLWIYPRGKAVKQDNTVELLAGAAGLANALGADMVKIKMPEATAHLTVVEQLRIIKRAAGNTKVLCAGGKRIDTQLYLNHIKEYINDGKIDGVAVGRNIFQQNLHEAIDFTHKIADEVYGAAKN